MKRCSGATLIALIGLMTMPAWAAEFQVSGFFDTIIPHVDSNVSSFFPGGDADMTREDHNTFARQRTRLFFSFVASDDLQGVFALEIDNVFGAPPVDAVGSGCIIGSGRFRAEQCGFRNGIDTNSLEIKQVYVDFRVPQLPIGNRFRLGGIPANITPLHPFLLYTIDAGGGSVQLDVTDRISLLLHYIQLEEDLDRFRGSAKLGEDYLAAATLMLNPLPALDVHLIGAFAHLQAPFGSGVAGRTGPFISSPFALTNVTTEDRYYVGLDARYRLGNLSIEPSFIYLLGTRRFCTPGSLVNTFGELMPCSSPAGRPNEMAFNAFETQLVLQYTLGSWLWAGKFAYTSGQSGNDDLSNTGIGKRTDAKAFLPLGIDASHTFGDWFEILGRSEVDGTGIRSPYNAGEVGGFTPFGWQVVGAKAEYQAGDQLVLEGAVGAFWTVEKTICPTLFRDGSITGPCVEPIADFTGNSRYAGTEIDVGLRYTILPGLTWTPRFGWAFLGDAFQIQHRSVRDAWIFVNRVIYTF